MRGKSIPETRSNSILIPPKRDNPQEYLKGYHMRRIQLAAKTLASVAVLFSMARYSRAETQLDVTTSGTTLSQTASMGGTFIVSSATTQGAGSGNLNSFLRLQDNGAESGYNTSAGTPLNDKGGGFTTNLQLGAVPIVTVNGVEYRQFLVDVNQTSQTGFNVSLNQVQIFTSTSQIGGTTSAYNLSDASTSPSQNAVLSLTDSTANLVFQMSSLSTGGTSYTVLINQGSGSGTADAVLLVQNSLFNGLSGDTYITLFSQFGNPPPAGTATNDGYEEWAVNGTLPGGGPGPNFVPTPVPTSLVLLASCLPILGSIGVMRHWKRRN
jgi:hypothetical protein